MFEKFRELKREKFGPIHLWPGDTLQVTYREPDGEERVLVKSFFAKEQAMVITEALIFEGEFEGRRALGGLVLEEQK